MTSTHSLLLREWKCQLQMVKLLFALQRHLSMTQPPTCVWVALRTFHFTIWSITNAWSAVMGWSSMRTPTYVSTRWLSNQQWRECSWIHSTSASEGYVTPGDNCSLNDTCLLMIDQYEVIIDQYEGLCQLWTDFRDSLLICLWIRIMPTMKSWIDRWRATLWTPLFSRREYAKVCGIPCLLFPRRKKRPQRDS